MLLRFGVENFLSFRGYTEVSFVASKLDDGGYTMPVPQTDDGVLPVVAVFGANASGKSNLLEAVAFLRGEVANSARRGPSDTIERSAFALQGDGTDPSRFDCDVVTEGTRYQFGFVVDDKRVREEWLYAWPENRRRVLYERGIDGDDWYFGPSLRGAKSQIAELTKDNTLFVSTGAQLNHEVLTEFYNAICSTIIVASAAQLLLPPSAQLLAPENQDAVVNLLRAADLGVVGFRGVRAIEDEDFGRLLRGEIPDGLKEHLERAKTLRLNHRSATGSVELPPRMESLGTRTLINRLEPILLALKEGRVLVIDEFDLHLHPMLSAQLLSLFRNRATNPRGAQLLCVAHDSSLMRHLRRDEIYLVEKDNSGNSSVVPASHLRIRKDADLRALYESGRMGGVPRLDDLTAVLG